MSPDERVRQALHHHAERIEPGDGSWERLQQRVDEARRRRRHRWAGGATGAVAAAVLLVVAVASFVGNDARVVETGPAATSLPTTPPSSSVAPPPPKGPPPVPDDVPFAGVWPFHTVADLRDYLDPGGRRYDSPVEVAHAFAAEYLGMARPVAGEATFKDDGNAEVVLRPRGESGQPLPPGTMDTTVVLEPLGAPRPNTQDQPGGPWNVVSTTSSNIRLDGDQFRNGAVSPIAVSGEATAYEGTVQVEVRQAGMEAGEALGRDFVIAGAQGNFGPFATEIAFDPPSTDGLVALVLYTESAVDGSTLEATVVGLNFAAGSDTPPTTVPGQTEATVFFHRGEELVPVTRSLPATTGVLRAALEALLAGPTEEERTEGLTSWFSEETAGMLIGVTLDAYGTAVVDLGDLRSIIPGASTSAGGDMFMGQLNGTVFQFPTIERVEYRIEGSCGVFIEWSQRRCEVVEQPAGG